MDQVAGFLKVSAQGMSTLGHSISGSVVDIIIIIIVNTSTSLPLGFYLQRRTFLAGDFNIIT